MVKLIYLLFAHFIADFAIQSDFVAKYKFPDGKSLFWAYVMAGHCATHAIAVSYITGNPWLGVAEFVAHFAIDYLKCQKKIGIHQDQALHIACKIAWSVL